jgi:hypothetical protein
VKHDDVGGNAAERLQHSEEQLLVGNLDGTPKTPCGAD